MDKLTRRVFFVVLISDQTEVGLVGHTRSPNVSGRGTVRSIAYETIQTETLDALYFRDRAAFCHQLAAAAGAARLLAERLRALAKSYEHKALIQEMNSEPAPNGDAVMTNRPPEDAWDASAVIEELA